MWGTGTPLRQFTYNRDAGRILLKALYEFHNSEESLIATGKIHDFFFYFLLICERFRFFVESMTLSNKK